MARCVKVVHARPDQVYAVLADGWNYADWVVGAVHIRDVDATWPQPGAKVHHKVGAWPFLLADSTEVLALDPASRLVLKARLRPFGVARVELTWLARPDGRTTVVMSEQFVDGPALALRNRVSDVVIHQRNVEALRRLADMTRRYSGSSA